MDRSAEIVVFGDCLEEAQVHLAGVGNEFPGVDWMMHASIFECFSAQSDHKNALRLEQGCGGGQGSVLCQGLQMKPDAGDKDQPEPPVQRPDCVQVWKRIVHPSDVWTCLALGEFAECPGGFHRDHLMSHFGQPFGIASRARADIEHNQGLAGNEAGPPGVDRVGLEGAVLREHLRGVSGVVVTARAGFYFMYVVRRHGY